MKITRRDVLAGAAAAAASSALPTPVKAQAKKVLKVIPHADLKILDPIITTGYISRNHGYMVYDTLYALDDNFAPKPQMAEGHEISADKLKVQIKLRDGLAWHDNTAVTAEDCVASLKRWGAKDGMGQKLLGVIDKLEAPNARTIEISLKRPYALLFDSIGKISSNVPFMMPKRIAETSPDKAIEDAIGSGPFVFKKGEWVPGSKAVYEKFAGYKPRSEPVSSASGGKIAKAERIEWLTIADSNTAMNALINGEVDFWEQVTPDLIPLVQQAKGVKVEILDPTGSMGWGRINHLAAPTNNPLIRRAVLKAVNQEDYLRAAIGNPELYKLCESWYPCGSTYATSDGWAEYAKQNVEEAKQLLKEAGYKGEKFVILQPTDHPVLNPFTLVTAEKLRAIGLNVELQAMDWSTVLSRRNSKEPTDKGGWNMFHTWWIGGDVLNPLTAVAFGGQGESGWVGWTKDDKVEELRAAFTTASDAAELKKVASALQRRLYEIGHSINLGQFFVPVGYRANVKGLIKSPVQFFWNMEA